MTDINLEYACVRPVDLGLRFDCSLRHLLWSLGKRVCRLVFLFLAPTWLPVSMEKCASAHRCLTARLFGGWEMSVRSYAFPVEVLTVYWYKS